MKNVRAFTLIELLIGMILSAIIISFAYSCYSILSKQALIYRDLKKQINETMTLNSVLNNDFINSEFVLYHDKTLTIEGKGNKLEYIFTDTYILRQDREVLDSFHLAAGEINLNYLTETNLSPKTLVNELSFDAKVLGENESFHFIKNYSSENAMKLFISPN